MPQLAIDLEVGHCTLVKWTLPPASGHRGSLGLSLLLQVMQRQLAALGAMASRPEDLPTLPFVLRDLCLSLRLFSRCASLDLVVPVQVCLS